MATRLNRLMPLQESTAPIAGVAVTITRHRNTHIGIVYRDNNNRPLLLHLRFHLDLEVEDLDASYLCVDPELEIEDAEIIAGHCRLIAKDRPEIRFAIHSNSAGRFALKRPKGRPGPPKMALSGESKGLNCCTFVMAVFSHAGPALLDVTAWPARATDKMWHQQLIKWLREKKAEPSHIANVAKDIGCARVRPEELAGACLEEHRPAKFEQCEPNGATVLSHLETHTGRTLRVDWAT